MKRLLFFLALPFLLASCATITAKKDYNLRIYSNSATARAVVNDSTYTLPAKVKVMRSKEDLAIKLLTDSVTKEYTVKSSPNPRFIYGNLMLLQAAPIGHLVDFTSQKRFYYGVKVNLNDNDTITTIVPRLARGYINYFSKTFPASKGDIYFSPSIINGSLFYMQPRNEPGISRAGLLGIGAGFEYYYRDNKFLKANAGYSLGAEPFEYFGTHISLSAANFTLTDNYKFNRFSIGYGINFGIYEWKLVNPDYEFPPSQQFLEGGTIYPEDLRPPMTKNSHAFGATINIYHQFMKNLWAGVVYNPTFYNVFPSSEYKYQHIISMEVTWKVQLRKNNQWQILKRK